MKPKTQFTFNIVGLTVLMIGGLTLAIMMFVMMSVAFTSIVSNIAGSDNLTI